MSRLVLLASAVISIAGAMLFASAPQSPPANGQLPPTAAANTQTATPPQSNDSLDGTWELTAVIDDGKPVTLDTVKQTMIKDARIIVKGQLASLLKPDGTTRELAFVINPNANPRTIDLAGAVKTGGKGIYMRDGNSLMICLSSTENEARPAQIASLPGSDTILMILQRVSVAAPAAVTPAPATTPTPTPKPPAPAAVVPSDDATRKMLVGTWGHQTDDKIVKVTFNPDGSYTIIEAYKKGLKKLFEGEDRTSGSWKLKDGEIMLTATSSTNKDRRGQIYSYRITSINEGEVLYVDNITGQRRIEWKLR